ncbi:MAG TPA: type II CAAX endopeptidase family protein [Longimicrobiales bacterium]|nr:type II CAAX endopeptidase family protein [Longimicrobiales bacterium]
MRGSAKEWVGCIARIVAWTALLVGLTIVLHAVWDLLPLDPSELLLPSSVITAGAALIAGAVLVRFADGRSPAAIGIAVSKNTPREIGIGVLIGVTGLAVATLALLVSGTLAFNAQAGSAGAWIGTIAMHAAIFTVAALAEEALFRGYAFQVLARTAGPAAAVVVSSILFALAHGANPSIGTFALINIFLAGILLGIAYLRTLSLWFATAVHMGWNWAMASLFDLPVSGLQMFDTPLYEPAVGGPAWWSGAMFGPEGGLVGTIGFGVALVLTLRWRAVRPDPAMLAARPLVIRTEGETNVG